MRTRLVLSFPLLLLLGAGLPLTSLSCRKAELRDGATVRVITLKPDNCKDLGPVEGLGGGLAGGYLTKQKMLEAAMNDARNKAARKGATHLLAYAPEIAHGTAKAPVDNHQAAVGHGDGASASAKVVGSAYKCPPGVKPRAGPAAPSLSDPTVSVDPAVTASLPPAQPQPTSAEISLAPLGDLESIVVFYATPATPQAPASETEIMRIDDKQAIEAIAGSLATVEEDPIKYVPTHRIEFMGKLGTQSLLYGFGYLQYAGKTFRLTDPQFEQALELKAAVGP